MPNETDGIIKRFEQRTIRSLWDEERQEWYFSIVDVVGALTDSPDYQTGRKYWNKLKQRLHEEGSELVTNCHQLKMPAADGKMRLTDAADTGQLLRIIQSIPSPKAEPFKLWLAQVGRERIEETIDPELSIERALETYLRKGYSREWINQRLQAIQVRRELTDEWQARGVKKRRRVCHPHRRDHPRMVGNEHPAVQAVQGTQKGNLRDNMSTTEIVLNMLAEASTKDISQAEAPETFAENQQVARKGGEVAGIARQALEARTGRSVITPQNALDFHRLIEDVMEETAALPETEKLRE